MSLDVGNVVAAASTPTDERKEGDRKRKAEQYKKECIDLSSEDGPNKKARSGSASGDDDDSDDEDETSFYRISKERLLDIGQVLFKMYVTPFDDCEGDILATLIKQSCTKDPVIFPDTFYVAIEDNVEMRYLVEIAGKPFLILNAVRNLNDDFEETTRFFRAIGQFQLIEQ